MVVILFNSSHFLEVAINRADKNAESGASTLLGIKEGDQIIINFINTKKY
jgi:S-adenosylmethionine hydrolase